MEPVSRYQVFCRIAETGSFTRTAEQLHYTQSAVSQSVQALERDLGVTLLQRSRSGVTLTRDGAQYYPYIQQIAAAEAALARKKEEMEGLLKQRILIGGFSSIGRHILPPAMERFRAAYPDVRFEIRQGDYSDVYRWVQEGTVDLGFIDADAAGTLERKELYREPLLAVLPQDHPLARQDTVSMAELLRQPFIMLAEGENSSVRALFAAQGLAPQPAYEVYDDYSILAMVRRGLGVSVLFRNVLRGYDDGVAVRPLAEGPFRVMAVIWKDLSVMPLAARRFLDILISEVPIHEKDLL